MEFGSFIAGIVLMILTVLLEAIGFAVLFGLIKSIATSFGGSLRNHYAIRGSNLVCLRMVFLQVRVPERTINVHNQ